MSVMREVRIEKVTLNFGAGSDQKKLEKGMKLLKHVTGINPIKTHTQKRIATWGIRPGLPVGCKITIRGKEAEELLKRLLAARDNMITEKCIDNNGNVCFGIPEYIDIPGVEYDPDLGVMGFEIAVTLGRPGNRIKRRKIRPQRVHQRHTVSRDDALKFMEEKFSMKVGVPVMEY